MGDCNEGIRHELRRENEALQQRIAELEAALTASEQQRKWLERKLTTRNERLMALEKELGKAITPMSHTHDELQELRDWLAEQRHLIMWMASGVHPEIVKVADAWMQQITSIDAAITKAESEGE